MNPKDRIRMQFQSWKNRKLWRQNKPTKAELELTGVLPTSALPTESTTNIAAVKSSRRQFTVTKVKKPTTVSEKIWHRIINPDDFSYTPNTYVVKYVNWSYTSGFFIVFLSFLALFLFIIFVFGLFLKWAGEAQPHCIVVAGDRFGTNQGTTLADGFALSWTTFR